MRARRLLCVALSAPPCLLRERRAHGRKDKVNALPQTMNNRLSSILVEQQRSYLNHSGAIQITPISPEVIAYVGGMRINQRAHPPFFGSASQRWDALLFHAQFIVSSNTSVEPYEIN